MKNPKVLIALLDRFAGITSLPKFPKNWMTVVARTMPEYEAGLKELPDAVVVWDTKDRKKIHLPVLVSQAKRGGIKRIIVLHHQHPARVDGNSIVMHFSHPSDTSSQQWTNMLRRTNQALQEGLAPA